MNDDGLRIRASWVANQLRDIAHHIRSDGRTLKDFTIRLPHTDSEETIHAIGNDFVTWGERLRILANELDPNRR